MKLRATHSCQIRPMTYSDGLASYDLWKKAGLTVVDVDRELYELKAIISKNSSTCFVAHKGSHLIGTVIGAYNGRRAWIYHLAVDPKFQRKGIGTALLRKTEHSLKALRITKILLGVGYPNLKTVTFYEGNGYSVMNDEVLMEKNYWHKKLMI